MKSQLSLTAPAKVNLFFDIISRFEDGYHEVLTVLQEISLCDILEFSYQKKEITVSCEALGNLPLSENLVYKAAQALQQYASLTEGVHITITKNIPIAAGLGGGSSDAAATLKGLNKLWGLSLSNETLCTLARSLGADVPFFISGGTALCSGRGDRIEQQFSLKNDYWIVLVNPGFPVSTKEVYSQVKFPLTKSNPNISLLHNSLEEGILIPVLIYNRLEEVVLKKYPLLASLKNDLLQAGCSVSLLSGSGPTVFALTETESKAQMIQESIVDKYAQAAFTHVCHTSIR